MELNFPFPSFYERQTPFPSPFSHPCPKPLTGPKGPITIDKFSIANSQWILPRRDAEFAEKKGRMISFSAPSATYSSSKVIHRWRGETGFCSPQPSVNNFGGGQKMYCQQPSLLLNRKVGHAGTGRRILRPNVTTFSQRLSLRFPALRCKGTLRTFRLQEQSWQRRTPISLSPRRSPRAPLNEQQNGLL
jgi:hypothetical protein